MAYQTIISDAGDQMYRTGFASNTDGSGLLNGRIVALRGGDETIPLAQGGGFGAAMDYPLSSTNSILVGICYPTQGRTTATDGTVFRVLQRGLHFSVKCWATVTQNLWMTAYDTNAPAGLAVDIASGSEFAKQQIGYNHATVEDTGLTTTTAYITIV